MDAASCSLYPAVSELRNSHRQMCETVCIHFQLAHIGVPKEQVTWSRVTLTSDKWISVRHDNPEDLSSRRATVSAELD